MCAFCSLSFKSFNSTQMQVHITRESQDSIRIGACKNAPAACKEFYLAERDREVAKSREKEAARTELYNQAAQLSMSESESCGRRAPSSPSPRQERESTYIVDDEYQECGSDSYHIHAHTRGHNAMDVFRSRMCVAVRARKEQKAGLETTPCLITGK